MYDILKPPHCGTCSEAPNTYFSATSLLVIEAAAGPELGEGMQRIVTSVVSSTTERHVTVTSRHAVCCKQRIKLEVIHSPAPLQD